MAPKTIASTVLQLSLSSQPSAVNSVKVASDEAISIDALEICSRYLASLQNGKDINDTKNALIRYFIPSVGGPMPSAVKYKPTSPEEIQAAFEFLKSVPLTVLTNSPDIASKLLDTLKSSPSQIARVRHHLRSLVDWAQEHSYLSPPENPIPAGVCDHIKVGVFKGLNLKSANARQILEEYLEQIEDREAELDTINSVIRFFVPGCDGPLPQHKPALDCEIEAGLKYLETIPLEYLVKAPEIATVALNSLEITVRHGTRIRNALRDLIKWAISQQYLPKPNSITPWGKEHLSQGLLREGTQTEKRQTPFEIHEEYCRHLEQNGRKTEINAVQTAIVRYFVPGCGGPVPMHARATTQEVQAGLAYLKTVPLARLSEGIELIETEFDRLAVPLSKRRPIRSRLRGWLNWFTEQNANSMTSEEQEPQPVFNTFYTNGTQREFQKPGMALHENRCPVHTLCAKRFPGDYVNDYLQRQLDTYQKWRRSNGTTPGSLKPEIEQIFQMLGWLHRYEGVPLSELRFEQMITQSKLVFKVSEYETYDQYLRQKEIGTEEARLRAADDEKRVSRYLEFTGENPKSQTRRVFIVLSIAKFLYKDARDSDDFSADKDIPILRRLLNLQATLKKKSKTTRRTIEYSETSTSWKQAVIAMEMERSRADLITIPVKDRTIKGYRIQPRPDTAIANDLQRFLSIVFCIAIPSRSRTFYDLRIGETFKEGILTSSKFLSIQDLKNQGLWEKYKDSVRFYIHHGVEDYKTGKSMTTAMLDNNGWWAEMPNVSFGDVHLYDYIQRWLEWGRATKGKVNHNFFFRKGFSPEPMNGHTWSDRIRTIFKRWTGVPVSPTSIRKMFTSQFPQFTKSAALLLQHSETIHGTDYDMRQTIEIMQPVMQANEGFITGVLSDLEENTPNLIAFNDGAVT